MLARKKNSFWTFSILMEKHPVRGKTHGSKFLAGNLYTLRVIIALVVQFKSSVSWFHVDLRV